jgi:hypothetical protein
LDTFVAKKKIQIYDFVVSGWLCELGWGTDWPHPNLIAATLHFPHFRLSGTGLKEWPTPQTYFDDFKLRAGGDWSHSEFSDIKVVDSSQTKVHVDLEVLRYDTNNELIARFRSLWVLTCDQGRWAFKFRSSFAPK